MPATSNKAPSVKQLMINKSNARIVVITSVAAFVVVFCAVAAFTLAGQLAYQNRVLGKKKAALTQLKTNLTNISSLQNSYQAFSTSSQNILGGNPDGTGPQDGDNAKIVLDALPSKYDFPALTTSLEKILTSQNVQIQSITGTDDELAQSATTTSSPQPVEMPFEIVVNGTYDQVKGVIGALQASIRPIQVTSLDVTSGSDGTLTMTIDAKTYYQPEKALSIKQEVVQ